MSTPSLLRRNNYYKKNLVEIEFYCFVDFSNPLLYHETEVIYAGKSLVLTDGDLNQTVECVSYSYPFPEFVWSISFPDEEVCPHCIH